MSNQFNCGAECGINVIGDAVAANQRHWWPNNTVVIDTSVFRSGAKSFRCDASSYVASTGNSLDHVFFTTGQSVVSLIHFFRVSDATPAAATRLASFQFVTSGTATCAFTLTTAGVLQFDLGAGAAAGPTLSADTWYGIEVEINVSANPWTARWRTWDAGVWTNRSAPTNRALAADTLYGFKLDNFAGSGVSSGTNVWYDDIAAGLSTAAGADYAPVGLDLKVLRYRPNADGTHSFTAGDFGYNAAGGDVATNATDVYTYVDDDDQTSLADFIRQKVIRGTGYIEVGFADEAAEKSPRGVTVVSALHSSGTGANTSTTKLSDDNFTSSVDLWANDDVSAVTIHQRGKTPATKPSGDAWTAAAVNSAKVRWGYAGDVTDIPYLDSVALEVSWEVLGSWASMVMALPGLVAYYPMREPSGTLVDNAQHTSARDATLSGTGYTLGVAGPITTDPGSKGITFSAAGSSGANAADEPGWDLGTSDFCMGCWMDLTASWPGSSQFLLGRGTPDGGTGFEMMLAGGAPNVFSSRLNATTINSADTTTISGTGWHFVALDMDRDGNGQWYLDGEPYGTGVSIAAHSATSIAGTSSLYFGRRSAGSYLDGKMSELFIAKSLLGSAGAAAMYAAATEAPATYDPGWTLGLGYP